MKAVIRIADGTVGDLTALAEWLNDESELRGRCHIIRSSVLETELGSVPELLTVELGAGGAGTVLASSLVTWLQTRKTNVKIEVKADGREVVLDIETVRDVTPLLQQILRMNDDD
jgi:hypothetical protein